MSGRKKKNEFDGASARDLKIEPGQESPQGGKGEVSEGKTVSENLESAEKKAEENYDRFLRVTAEFENYKKRAEREMNDFRKFANGSLVKEILPVVDNLERALEAECDQNEDAVKGLREGIEMTLKGLLDALEKFGVVAMDTLKKPFDPNFHQAVSQEETDRQPDNTVSREFQKGYILNERLLRPAMVVVSKKPTPEEAPPAEDKGKKTSKIKVTVL